MRSFSTAISLVASLALATFSSAAPVDLPADVSVTINGKPIVAVPRAPFVSLPAIVTNLATQLEPMTNQLVNVVQANATVAALTPITNDITFALNEAVAAVNGLVGLELSKILTDVDHVLSLKEVAALVSNLLTLVLGALSAVLRVASASQSDAVFPLLAGVGLVLGELLRAILSLVTGLTAILLPLVDSLIPIIVNLNLAQILALLGMSV